MKQNIHLYLYILCLAVCCLSSCRGKQQAVLPAPVIIERHDSVRTEYVERVRIDTVTVTLTVPNESAMQLVRDTTSQLETAFAISRAWITPDGYLGHLIRNKERPIETDVFLPVTEKETKQGKIEYVEKPVPVPYEVRVEREFSQWEKFRLGAFWWLMALAIAESAWIFRKHIAKLLRR